MFNSCLCCCCCWCIESIFILEPYRIKMGFFDMIIVRVFIISDIYCAHIFFSNRNFSSLYLKIENSFRLQTRTQREAERVRHPEKGAKV